MSTAWTPNDYSNIITIGAAAVGSVMLILFKSRCSKVSLCCGLWSCDREVNDEDAEPIQEEPVLPNP
tara:strand:- start:543 stop:743 length:201 start_codon:yes stop_codon:yes gene_type:complete